MGTLSLSLLRLGAEQRLVELPPAVASFEGQLIVQNNAQLTTPPQRVLESQEAPAFFRALGDADRALDRSRRRALGAQPGGEAFDDWGGHARRERGLDGRGRRRRGARVGEKHGCPWCFGADSPPVTPVMSLRLKFPRRQPPGLRPGPEL